MLVGEAPGANEERTGQPFVGAAGELLEAELAAAGIQPSQVFFTNICQERPSGNDIRRFHSDDGAPNDKILDGLIELQKQIERLKPNVIVPLGNYPLRYLTGKGKWRKAKDKDESGWTGIGIYRGSILEGTALTGRAKCVPSYHPAYVLRDYSAKHILRTDLTRVAGQCVFPEIRRPRKCRRVLREDSERALWSAWLTSPTGTTSPQLDVEGLPEAVCSSSFLTFDIEYIGDKLLCVGFTRHADVGVTFPIRRQADIGFVRDILLSGVPLCAQNGMFDGSILEWFHDIACTRFLKHDTMMAMHAAYTELPKDLGFIGSLYTEIPVWWDHFSWDDIKAGRESIEVVYPYNCDDVIVTHSAMEQLLEDELQDKLVHETYRHEMQLVPALWTVSKRGVPIDVEKLQTLKTTLQEENVTLEAGLYQINGNVPLNSKSGPQVAKLLYEKLGFSKIGRPKTPTGLWQMNDALLAQLLLEAKDKIQVAAVKMIRANRERRDLISKFCDIDLDDDGRMRCHYDPAKTVTGRLSSREFYPTKHGSNLQNIPRDPRVRAIFVPSPARRFGYADLKSAESLVVAHITGDKEMLRLHSPEYMSGELDGHKYVASFLLQKPIELITGDERYLGKRVRHAGNYGLSWAKLMKMINADAQETDVSVTAEQAKKLIAMYRRLHPGLEDWWRDVALQLYKTHTITTLLGRRRVFLDRPDNVQTDAIAQCPQGTVADTLNIGLLRISPETYDHADWWTEQQFNYYEPFRETAMELRELQFETLLQVHDAIGFQAPESSLDRALPLLATAMTLPLPIKRRGVEPYEITIPVDIKIGGNWGEFDKSKPEENPDGLRTWKPAA